MNQLIHKQFKEASCAAKSSKFSWRKLGLIFKPTTNKSWMKSHAQVPTPLVLDDRVRIYYATRPKPDRSLTTFVDIDRNDPSQIIYEHDRPILNLGKRGEFDEHGIMPSSVVTYGRKTYLFYSGWQSNLLGDIPYANYTGLAVSEDGGLTFVKSKHNPVISNSDGDIYSATSPYVFRQGKSWHMWYSAGTQWLNIAGRKEHTYHIKHAQSRDGLVWIKTRRPVVEQRDTHEAVTRPAVVSIRGQYYMWYCYRGSVDFRDGENSYRIGLAHSTDLQQWRRIDERSGISPSKNGWDSKMLAYPAIYQVGEKTYMLYNGNGFGANGFGVAQLELSAISAEQNQDG